MADRLGMVNHQSSCKSNTNSISNRSDNHIHIKALIRYGQAALPILFVSAIIFSVFVIVTTAVSRGNSVSSPEKSQPDTTNTDDDSNGLLQVTTSPINEDLYIGYRPDGYAAISAPSKTLAFSFVTSGIVAEIPVVENQVVQPGQVLARLDSEVQSYSLQAQLIVAEDMSEKLMAEQRLALADFDLQNILEAEQQDAVARREVERAKIDKTLREIELNTAQTNHKRNQLLYQRDKAFFDDMTIKANFKGIVARIDVLVGEAVDELQSVVRLVAIDPLWMDVAVPVQLGLALKIGDQAIVQWRDLPGKPPAQGKVLWVSPVNDASSNKIILRLEIENPNKLPAGLHAKVKFPETDYKIAGQ